MSADEDIKSPDEDIKLPDEDIRPSSSPGEGDSHSKKRDVPALELILAELLEHPKTTIRALADKLAMPKSAIERTLQSFKASGWLQRQGSRKNGKWIVLAGPEQRGAGGGS